MCPASPSLQPSAPPLGYLLLLGSLRLPGRRERHCLKKNPAFRECLPCVEDSPCSLITKLNPESKAGVSPDPSQVTNMHHSRAECVALCRCLGWHRRLSLTPFSRGQKEEDTPWGLKSNLREPGQKPVMCRGHKWLLRREVQVGTWKGQHGL